MNELINTFRAGVKQMLCLEYWLDDVCESISINSLSPPPSDTDWLANLSCSCVSVWLTRSNNSITALMESITRFSSTQRRNHKFPCISCCWSPPTTTPSSTRIENPPPSALVKNSLGVPCGPAIPRQWMISHANFRHASRSTDRT